MRLRKAIKQARELGLFEDLEMGEYEDGYMEYETEGGADVQEEVSDTEEA